MPDSISRIKKNGIGGADLVATDRSELPVRPVEALAGLHADRLSACLVCVSGDVCAAFALADNGDALRGDTREGVRFQRRSRRSSERSSALSID